MVFKCLLPFKPEQRQVFSLLHWTIPKNNIWKIPEFAHPGFYFEHGSLTSVNNNNNNKKNKKT